MHLGKWHDKQVRLVWSLLMWTGSDWFACRFDFWLGASDVCVSWCYGLVQLAIFQDLLDSFTTLVWLLVKGIKKHKPMLALLRLPFHSFTSLNIQSTLVIWAPLPIHLISIHRNIIINNRAIVEHHHDFLNNYLTTPSTGNSHPAMVQCRHCHGSNIILHQTRSTRPTHSLPRSHRTSIIYFKSHSFHQLIHI